MKSTLMFLLLFTALARTSNASPATHPTDDSAASARAASDEACMKAAQKICPGQAMGKEMLACLKDHKTELPEICQEKASEVKVLVKSAISACKDDFKRVCKDVQPGGGRIMECIKTHESELSPECKSKVDEIQNLAPKTATQ